MTVNPAGQRTSRLFPLQTWRRVLRETGCEVLEGLHKAGGEEYTVFARVQA